MSDGRGLEPVASLPAGQVQMHLWGFMGSGKSTVARALARRLVWSYLDLDALVERHAGKSIAKIFAEEGEQAFREIERHVLAQAIQKPRTVVALGGGTPIDEANRALTATRAVSVWLKVSFETCRERVGDDPRRPLFGDVVAARELFTLRESVYATADLVVDAQQPAEAVAKAVWSELFVESDQGPPG